MSAANFDAGTRRIHAEVVAESTEAIRAAALDFYYELQRDAKISGTGSPIASGRYVASMRVSVNHIDHSSEPADPKYKYPPGRGPRPLPARTIANRPISRVSAGLRTFRLGDTIYVTNSVPYVRRIERSRHSWQAPDGVFGPVARLVWRRFANLALRVRNV